jgi:hypothetical protein
MKFHLFLLSAAAMVNTVSSHASSNGNAVHDQVILGTAGNYAILAKTGISTVPTSAITGNIAVSPIAATAMTGFTLFLDPTSMLFSTSTQVVGSAYSASYGGATAVALTTAVSDMETAYNEAAGHSTSWGSLSSGVATICVNDDGTGCTPFLNLKGGEIGGLKLGPGVYTFNTDVTIYNGAGVTFNANGDASAVFIIQTTGSVKQAAGKRVTLEGGALAQNIFWQVAQGVVVGATAHMEGVILAKTAVVFQTTSSLNGRILSQTAVTLDAATIVEKKPVPAVCFLCTVPAVCVLCEGCFDGGNCNGVNESNCEGAGGVWCDIN